MISTIKNNFYLILCTRLSSFFHHATSDHSPCCSFNRIQTVYVVYVCVCVYVFINDHFKTRILWSLCMYVRIYVSCVSRSLFIRSSFISLSSSLSRNAQWQSVEIDVFYLELVLLFFVLRKDIRIGAAVLVNESGWTFVHRCWRIDDEKRPIYLFLSP